MRNVDYIAKIYATERIDDVHRNICCRRFVCISTHTHRHFIACAHQLSLSLASCWFPPTCSAHCFHCSLSKCRQRIAPNTCRFLTSMRLMKSLAVPLPAHQHQPRSVQQQPSMFRKRWPARRWEVSLRWACRWESQASKQHSFRPRGVKLRDSS